MKLPSESIGSLALFLIIAIQFTTTSCCCQDPPKTVTPDRAVPAPGQWSPSGDDMEKRTGFSDKIDSVLYDLIQSTKKSGTVSPDEAKRKSLRISGERVQVSIAVSPEEVEHARAAIELVDGEVTGVSMNRKEIQGWVPVLRLEQLAKAPSILYIRRPAYAVPLK